MNKKLTLIIILVAIVVLLGILDLMLLKDLQNVSNDVNKDYKNTKVVEKNSVRIIEMVKHQERLFPQTIYVNKGDTLILSFAVDEPTEISFNDFGIDETVQLDNIEFVADKSGVFDFYCLDCEHKLSGVLIVN